MARKPTSYDESAAPAPMEDRPWAPPEAKAKAPDEDVLLLMRQQSVVAAGAWQQNHDRAEESVDFAEGLNHWPEMLRQSRDQLGQPCLVLNDMPIFIARIAGEQLQNRQSIHVSPEDSFGGQYDFLGEKGEKRNASTVREGIIRQIEYRSNAQAHYDRAHQHAVDGGLGWLRVFTRFANSRDFDQELVVSSVKNRWSVFADPEVQEPDHADMRYGFVVSSMLRRQFQADHPNAMQGDLGNLPEVQREFWGAEDRISVAEYMTRHAVERELLLLSNGQTGYLDEMKDHIAEGGGLIDADGAPVMGEDGKQIGVKRRRQVYDWCVYWRKVTAFSVLQGPIKLPFSTVPLVPVFGRATDRRNGTTLLSSAIHHAMDTKRMEEYWMSAATGRVALSPLAPWVGDARAFEGYEGHWERANREPLPYLPYNAMQGEVPAPTRTPPPDMPVAELGITASMHDRTKAAIGIYDASLGAQSNETSGRAINARDRQSSTSTYIFGDNLGKAIRRVGILLNEALPVVYDTERTLGVRAEDDTTEWMTVNKVGPGPDGTPSISNSLTAGAFGVVVTAGPSFVTQRQEAADAQLTIMQAAPDTIPIMLDNYAINADWPGNEKLAYRARKMMDPNLLTAAEKEEMAEMDGPKDGEVDPATGQPAGQPPDPAQEAAMQAQQVQMQALAAETEAKMAKAEADIATADAQKATAAATKAKAEADMAEAQLRMAALQQGGMAPQLPTVGQPNINPNGGFNAA